MLLLTSLDNTQLCETDIESPIQTILASVNAHVDGTAGQVKLYLNNALSPNLSCNSAHSDVKMWWKNYFQDMKNLLHTNNLNRRKSNQNKKCFIQQNL